MKPPRFDYVAAASVEEAVAALVEGGPDAKVLAGGQSLVPMLAFRIAQPSLLVDLNRIPELAFVREADGGGLAVGAMTRTHELEVSALVAERWPLAADAAPLIGHRTIRNRGTIGGSVVHADPAAELPAVLLATNATLVLRGPQGERTLAAADFFVTVFTTALEPGELLTEIRIPAAAPRTGTAFVEISRRHGDFALAGAAATVTLDDGGAVSNASVVLIGVGATPVAVPEAAELLRGGKLTEERARDAGERASAATDPSSDLHASATYRKEVSAVVTRRALLQAAERASRQLSTD